VTIDEKQSVIEDRMAVDAEGGIWVTPFSGDSVRPRARRLDAVIDLQVANPTRPAFAGQALARRMSRRPNIAYRWFGAGATC
jgi:sugar lactone lactonase YvrE